MATYSIDDWQVLILDTGPLWESILYTAAFDQPFRSLRGELQHLKSKEQRVRLAQFIGRFGLRTTTAYVVSEIGGFIRKTKRAEGIRQIWSLVYDEFKNMGMDERACQLLSLQPGQVADNGLADASLLNLAIGLGERRPQVLTIDSGLVSECKRNGLKAVHLYEVIYQ